MTRPSFDQVAFELLDSIAKRSTCPRLHTASLIATKDNRILATGYNGSLPGQEHCDDYITTGLGEYAPQYELRGCLVIDQHCQRTVHSEQNAITQAAKYGIPILGCKMYCLHQPCLICAKLAISAGIDTIMVGDYYGKVEELAKAHQFMIDAGIEIIYRKPYMG